MGSGASQRIKKRDEFSNIEQIADNLQMKERDNIQEIEIIKKPMVKEEVLV